MRPIGAARRQYVRRRFRLTMRRARRSLRFAAVTCPGDPDATGAAILKLVDAEKPPLRIFFGSGGLPMTKAEYARRIETWEKWNDLSVAAQGDLAAKR